MEQRGASHVEEQIRRGNPWYVGSQFEWAEKPAIRRIYERRWQYFQACLERARRRLDRPRLRVLDAGCGDGYWLWRLSALPDLDLTGLDYNEIRVERARSIAPAATVVHGDLLGFRPEEPFDVVFLNQVIEHVHDDAALLRGMAALLRPGGSFVLGTPNEGSILQRQALRRARAHGRTDHVHFYTEAKVRARLESAGFRVASVLREIFFFFDYRLYYALAANRLGFAFLELLTRLFPSECSDYYFECVKREPDPG